VGLRDLGVGYEGGIGLVHEFLVGHHLRRSRNCQSQIVVCVRVDGMSVVVAAVAVVANFATVAVVAVQVVCVARSSRIRKPSS